MQNDRCITIGIKCEYFECLIKKTACNFKKSYLKSRFYDFETKPEKSKLFICFIKMHKNVDLLRLCENRTVFS